MKTKISLQRRTPGQVSAVATRDHQKKLEAKLSKMGAAMLLPAAEGKRLLAMDAKQFRDSFQNFAQNLGIGTDSPLSTATYGFNPITRIRTLLEWIHRGSWLGGQAIDIPANDMTREGVDLKGDIDPEDVQTIEARMTALGCWNSFNQVIKWARLYGGCIGVWMIDGHDVSTPLNIDRIAKGAFKGIAVLDRWSVDPSLFDLVTELGPDLGKPKFYTCNTDAPAFRGRRIHYSRVFRMVGVELPYWQAVMENLWGASDLERIYDRMVAFDSASTGAAQLVYKAYIRTYKLKDFRQVVAAGGDLMAGLVAQVEVMRRFQSQEGITLLDMEDEFEAHTNASFSGLSDALNQFGQQLAGALQIPLVRLFGQSPAGFSSDETDLKNYYDGVKQRQELTLRDPATKTVLIVAQSEGIKLKPEGIEVEFRSLWQPTDKEKAETAEIITRTVVDASNAGLVSDQVAMKELRKSSEQTGIYGNISEEDIDAAEDEAVPKAMTMGGIDPETGQPFEGPEAGGEGGEGGEGKKAEPGATASAKSGTEKKGKTKDDAGITASAEMAMRHGLQVVIENPTNTHRHGFNWDVIMPASYGYLQGTEGADGEGLDVFVGTDYGSDLCVIINQRAMEHDGESPGRLAEPHRFDEHKIMLGYESVPKAIADYLAGYSDDVGWKRIGAVEFCTVAELKSWLAHGDTKKPYNNNFR